MALRQLERLDRITQPLARDGAADLLERAVRPLDLALDPFEIGSRARFGVRAAATSASVTIRSGTGTAACRSVASRSLFSAARDPGRHAVFAVRRVDRLALRARRWPWFAPLVRVDSGPCLFRRGVSAYGRLDSRILRSDGALQRRELGRDFCCSPEAAASAA